MKGRYTLSRQKACQPCSTAKAKCERRAGRCTRCLQRGLTCSYRQNSPSFSDPANNDSNLMTQDSPTTLRPSSVEQILPIAGGHGPIAGIDVNVSSVENRNSVIPPASSLSASSPARASSTTLASSLSHQGHNKGHKTAGFAGELDFGNLNLICTIDVDELSRRWMNPYIPVPGQIIKQYPANIEVFIHRMLGSYASMAVRGHATPPFVHLCQFEKISAQPPLSTCLSLVRICERLLPGSEVVAGNFIQLEMKSVYEQHEDSDDLVSLSTLQSYLIYSLVQYFKLPNLTEQNAPRDFINLQDLACSSSRKGIVCAAEQQHTRPRWEEWIVAEAKRRTLYTINLLDNIISKQQGLPTFYGVELEGLPAPASKVLWEARTRQQWEAAYNVHLAHWPRGGLRIDELWPNPPDIDEQEVRERRIRVDHWLDGIDEFGTMIYAISSSTHNGP